MYRLNVKKRKQKKRKKKKGKTFDTLFWHKCPSLLKVEVREGVGLILNITVGK